MTAGAPALVDARGMRCPWPAVRLARAMREFRDVTLVADDPRAGAEVAALAAEHGWCVEPVDVAGLDEPCWRVRRD
ncbi:MAG: sulfurtransferase TusA family protein [Sphingopyxis sp.]|uniref:sulfurtransferase TusA family protein n=1 Tax=Sphingopyxis sp. TaxID=1908224 RepID=UPI002ABA93B9|nr:sulfurtransferase TusA family protein [Sphingopyxis sp.]MDZ3830244.1 sulfurtransferase TusA family protein [Sphingopyxis sp.]